MRAIFYLTIIAVLALLVACASSAPTATPAGSAPAATKPAAATAAPKAEPAATSKPAAPTAAPAANIKRGGTLRVGVQNDWVGQDPAATTVDSPSFGMMYEAMVFWRPDAKGIWGPTPGLATEWDLQGKTATFKLRKGVKFHDGSDWNAESAKWNLDRLLQPKSVSPDFKEAAQSVDIVDDYTIRINLKIPYAPLLEVLSDDQQNYWMASKAYAEKNGPDALKQHAVGTGPFQFVEWKTGDSVTTKRWDNYWMQGADGKSLPYLDGILFRWISDDSVRLLEIKSGNIEFTELIQGKDIPGVKADPNLIFLDGPYNGNMYRVMLSAESDPFASNYKLRQAAWYAVDREAIANTLGLGAGKASKYMILPGQIGYDESIPYYWYDKAKAAQLVKDAGYPNGVDLTYSVMSREVDRRQGEMIKQMWDAVGIRTTIDVLDRATWMSQFTQSAGNAKLQAGSWRNPSLTDPVLTVQGNWWSKATGNPAHEKDAEIDKCLEEAKTTYDNKQRQDIMKRCQTMDFERVAYYATPWYQPWNWVQRKELKGVGANYSTRIWQFREAWLDK
ncbi:MAG: ABC transporter substrate-binding protein [Chloroflexi bacterium]|nr:ABC transporter substrate-binding protein [Chloroflexota bacterium]MCL5025110.1 ABC transporter substrate-binding protein [Chloroflexota bacterium]